MAAGDPRVIAVANDKGGVGKTRSMPARYAQNAGIRSDRHRAPPEGGVGL